MFKCQNCQTIVPAHTKAQRVVTESRRKVYTRRERAFRAFCYGQHMWLHDKGGEGWEIVREIVVCPDCACKLK